MDGDLDSAADAVQCGSVRCMGAEGRRRKL